MTVIAFVAFH